MSSNLSPAQRGKRHVADWRVTMGALRIDFPGERRRQWPIAPPEEHRMIKTRITEMLGIEYPIVQAPMG